ncbi:hypothetical protein [Streptomyces erythrochromogenes]|uniref:hypothetical protein n=1 Tax=Streptomyces erythrochromogenes TaxID=285574 RepID=UPI003869BEA3|nr:hypothetical protein OG364_37415 [Streptomyces erythrochromogenes]
MPKAARRWLGHRKEELFLILIAGVVSAVMAQVVDHLWWMTVLDATYASRTVDPSSEWFPCRGHGTGTTPISPVSR